MLLNLVRDTNVHLKMFVGCNRDRLAVGIHFNIVGMPWLVVGKDQIIF